MISQQLLGRTPLVLICSVQKVQEQHSVLLHSHYLSVVSRLLYLQLNQKTSRGLQLTSEINFNSFFFFRNLRSYHICPYDTVNCRMSPQTYSLNWNLVSLQDLAVGDMQMVVDIL